MEKDWGSSTISSPAQLAEHTRRFIDQFCKQVAFPSAVEIRVDRHCKENPSRPWQSSSLRASLENQKLTIHMCEASLMGISPLALQGWLDMELARCHMELEAALYRVNFNEKIRPHFYMAGSGLHMVRHLVAHLETGLKNLIAAQLVIEIGNGRALWHSYYHQISPSVADRENYQRVFPYHWMRALFLCNKNRGYTPVALLANKGIAAELESYWWNCHAYLASEDQRFLRTLFSLSNQNPVKHFSETLVEMFKFVKTQLLIR